MVFVRKATQWVRILWLARVSISIFVLASGAQAWCELACEAQLRDVPLYPVDRFIEIKSIVVGEGGRPNLLKIEYNKLPRAFDPFDRVYWKIRRDLERVGVTVVDGRVQFDMERTYEMAFALALDGEDRGYTKISRPGRMVSDGRGLFIDVYPGSLQTPMRLVDSDTKIKRSQADVFLKDAAYNEFLKLGVPIFFAPQDKIGFYKKFYNAREDHIFLHDLAHFLGPLEAPEYFEVFALFNEFTESFDKRARLGPGDSKKFRLKLFRALNEQLLDLAPEFFDEPILLDDFDFNELSLFEVKQRLVHLFHRVIEHARPIGAAVRTPGFEALDQTFLFEKFYNLFSKMDRLLDVQSNRQFLLSRIFQRSPSQQKKEIVSDMRDLVSFLKSGQNLDQQIKRALEDGDLGKLEKIVKTWAE